MILSALNHKISRYGRALSALSLIVCGGLHLPFVGVATLQGEEFIPAFDVAKEANLDALLAEIKRALDQGDLTKAAELAVVVERLAPNDKRVAEQVDLINRLKEHWRISDLVLGDEADIQQQLAAVEIRVAIQRAEVALVRNELEKAHSAIQEARVFLQRFPDAQRLKAVKRLAEFAGRLERREKIIRQQVVQGHRQESQRRAVVVVEEVAQAEQAIFHKHVSRVIMLRQKGSTELALGYARRLISEFPSEEEAGALFDLLLAEVHEKRRLTTEQRKAEIEAEFKDRIYRSLIPLGFDGSIMYPDDWEQREIGRSAEFTAVVELPDWHRAIIERLATRLTVEFEDVQVSDALDLISHRTGVSIILDPEVRANINVPISLRVTNMKLQYILDWITRQAGTHWHIHKQAILVGGDADGEPILRLYDAAQLMYSAPNFPGPSNQSFLSNATGSGGGGFDLFGGDGEDGVSAMAPEDLVDLITGSIATDMWDDNESGFSIRIRNETQLLVHASPQIHVQIQEFFKSQARALHTMVHIEARWLEISDSYFEEVGVNWQNAPALLQGAVNTSAGYVRGYADKSIIATIANALPGAAVDVGSSLATGGLSLQLIYMGAAQVSAMLTAVEQKNKGRVLKAIEVTTLNGVRTHAIQADQISYIESYNAPTGGAGPVGGVLDPSIGVISAGFLLDVTPYVSADRKYVTMTIQPMFSDVTFSQDTIRTIASVNPTAADATGLLLGFFEYNIEFPNVKIDIASTSVTVPDGGTILLGGFGKSIEQSSKSSVPFLGTIPFLGRLFSMRGDYSTRSHLYLMTHVDIILLDEEESLL